MSKRKYEYYQIANQFGVENYFEYQKALSVFRRQTSPATLYGIDDQGEFTTIFVR